MTIAYVDLIGGVSGDMLLGAILDAGVKPADFRRELGKLSLSGWKLDVSAVIKKGIRATQIAVVLEPKAPRINSVNEAETILRRSSLSKNDQQDVMRIFSRLSEAEARVHGTSIANVHFHEMGSMDTLIDIVGVICGFRLLGTKRIVVSPFPIAHAGPATMELVKGAPVFGVDETQETVTPTGAAILTTMATSFALYPLMTVKRIGYGAGEHDLNHPNVLRLVIGESNNANADTFTESLVLLETNIDDLNPQIYDHLYRRLFDVGALDVWVAPIQMKKQRPGALLSILCEIQKSEDLTSILFEEGVTLGVRRSTIERISLPREIVKVKTRYGSIHVKIARFRGHTVRVSSEYDDCARLAHLRHIPIQTIMRAAISKWEHSS